MYTSSVYTFTFNRSVCHYCSCIDPALGRSQHVRLPTDEREIAERPDNDRRSDDPVERDREYRNKPELRRAARLSRPRESVFT